MILPIRVYQLGFTLSTGCSSALTAEDINELLQMVNRIWRRASIVWKLQSVESLIIEEAPTRCMADSATRQHLRYQLAQVSPRLPAVVSRRLWRLCLLQQMPLAAGGVYVPETATAFCSERAASGELNAAVLAHELGHALGLRHLGLAGNLMNPEALRLVHASLLMPETEQSTLLASVLNPAQIEQAQCQVPNGPLISQASGAVDGLYNFD